MALGCGGKNGHSLDENKVTSRLFCAGKNDKLGDYGSTRTIDRLVDLQSAEVELERVLGVEVVVV